MSAVSREASSGAATIESAWYECLTTIVPATAPASRPDRHCPVRVHSWRLPVHFAPFCSTLSHLLAFARVPFGDHPRSDAHHAAAYMRRRSAHSPHTQTFAFHEAIPGRGYPKDATASPPADRGRPITVEDPQTVRCASRSTVCNSRKPKV